MKIYYKDAIGVRETLVLLLLDKLSPIHTAINKTRKAWNLNSDQLIQYPENTLGNELGKFYKKEKFEPVDRAERHDVFHVLFNYPTKVMDECYLQFFLWGNGKTSLFTCGACLLSLVLFPSKWHLFKKHFNKGKVVLSISKIDFQILLPKNISELRQHLNFI